MTPAYDEHYLNDAMVELGDMIDYAVNGCGFSPDAFFMLFINSGIADKFGHGNPKYIGGMSGVELALEVYRCATGRIISLDAELSTRRSTEYWAGWLMAYCHWDTGYRFRDMIDSGMTLGHIMEMYAVEKVDISKFTDETKRLVEAAEKTRQTNLKTIRKSRGISQSELARLSGVTLRMIQLYEQRQNDINKAQSSTLTDLAQALGCRAEDLIEPVSLSHSDVDPAIKQERRSAARKNAAGAGNTSDTKPDPDARLEAETAPDTNNEEVTEVTDEIPDDIYIEGDPYSDLEFRQDRIPDRGTKSSRPSAWSWFRSRRK